MKNCNDSGSVFVPFNFIPASFWSRGEGMGRAVVSGKLIFFFLLLCSETSELLQYTANEAEDVERVRVCCVCIYIFF